ncbi:MAG TPA: V-type ATP synthase subunit K [bacterium]|nr:V-type ATP synthase subunit K [bacterium]
MSRKTAMQIAGAILLFNVLLVGLAIRAWAQGTTSAGVGGLTDAGLKTVGAGLAFLGGAIGTGVAQSRIIAAVLGAVAEDRSQLGFGIFLIAFPETLVILGFVMAFILR